MVRPSSISLIGSDEMTMAADFQVANEDVRSQVSAEEWQQRVEFSENNSVSFDVVIP